MPVVVTIQAILRGAYEVLKILLIWGIGGRLKMAAKSKFGPYHGFILFLLFDPQQRHLHIWNIYWFVT